MNQNENMNAPEDATITLTLDGDVQVECGIVAIFPAGDNDYIALLPLTKVDGFEEGEVLLYRFRQLEEDNVELLNIETDEEYEIVADAFDELLDEEEFNEMEDPE